MVVPGCMSCRNRSEATLSVAEAKAAVLRLDVVSGDRYASQNLATVRSETSKPGFRKFPIDAGCAKKKFDVPR
jgi:hypothetical protein